MKMYEHRRCNINSGMMRAAVDGQFVFLRRQTETNDGCLLIFLQAGLPGESAWALLILSSPAMRMNVRHYAWSAMTTIFALRKRWRILKSRTLTQSAALRFGSPKSLFSPHPRRSCLSSPPPHSFLSLCFLSLHLRIWFVMVTERGDRKKMFTSGKKKKNVSNVS